MNLQTVAGWATPSSRDWKDTAGMATAGVNPNGSIRMRVDQLPRQARLIPGASLDGSTASTASAGLLNPEFSRWLQGIPATWPACAPTATRSTRSSRRTSSAL
jgi:hypothetical protein